MARKIRGVLDWDPSEEEFEDAWVRWLKGYGAKDFIKALIDRVQDVQSTCIYCDRAIYLDVIEGGGIPDWRTYEGDYGCDASPETTSESSGSHEPQKLT